MNTQRTLEIAVASIARAMSVRRDARRNGLADNSEEINRQNDIIELAWARIACHVVTALADISENLDRLASQPHNHDRLCAVCAKETTFTRCQVCGRSICGHCIRYGGRDVGLVCPDCLEKQPDGEALARLAFGEGGQ